jgi:putative ABC transport system permease protein
MKVFFKFLTNNKLYTFITISGFAISLMFVLLLSVYIRQELSVDQFHLNKDRIYRLNREKGATFAPMVGSIIKDKIPEVESYTRLYARTGNALFPDKQMRQFEYLMADSSFFNIFSFKLKEGDPKYILAAKNSAALSSSFSKKVFGNESPLGKIFSIDSINFIISGVFYDIPENTHIQKCDAILNFNILADLWHWKELLTTFNNSSFGMYFLSKEGSDLPSKAPLILEQFKKEYWLYSDGFAKTLQFEPLTEVYFSNESGPAIRQNSSTLVFIFGVIALLILIIAIINYINLTVAQVGLRSKGIAIRKLMGCSNGAVLRQQIFESLTLSSLAAILAFVLAFLAESFFNTQMNCTLDLSKQFDIAFTLIMFEILFTTGFISGIVPAFIVIRYKPIEIVKGDFIRKTKSSFSKILISFQYFIAIVLLICSWTISRQSKFMQNFNPGYDKENLFWMDNSVTSGQKAAFRDILKSVPGVIEVSYCCGNPLDGGNNQSFNYEGKPVSFQEFIVDSLFFNIMGIKVNSTGTAFSKNGVWLNRSAVNKLELGSNPVSFRYYKNDVPVLGIIDDFNFRSLHSEIGPLMVRLLDEKDYPWSVLVKIDGSNLAETADRIRHEQSSFSGGVPVNSGFFDDTINQWYIKEQKQSKIIRAFTLLSIIISSMGIFAMTLFSIQQKVKEIGIRKINGAKASEVMIMLIKDFVKWTAIAFVIACPVAWYAMNKWLENFAYKAEQSWLLFGLAGITALSIALLTVSWQSWRASARNPVETLRYE